MSTKVTIETTQEEALRMLNIDTVTHELELERAAKELALNDYDELVKLIKRTVREYDGLGELYIDPDIPEEDHQAITGIIREEG